MPTLVGSTYRAEGYYFINVYGEPHVAFWDKANKRWLFCGDNVPSYGWESVTRIEGPLKPKGKTNAEAV